MLEIRFTRIFAECLGYNGMTLLPDEMGYGGPEIFIVIQRNKFLMAEALFHEFGHVVFYYVFRVLGFGIIRKVNWWYDVGYWWLLRALSKI